MTEEVKIVRVTWYELSKVPWRTCRTLGALDTLRLLVPGIPADAVRVETVLDYSRLETVFYVFGGQKCD